MSQRIQQPDQLQKFMDIFSQKFTAAAPPSAVADAEIPVYARYFSMEDIQGLVKFYESPLGQRVVKNLPDVVQRTQQAGVQLDQKAALCRWCCAALSIEYPELKTNAASRRWSASPGGRASAGSPQEPPRAGDGSAPLRRRFLTRQ